MLVITRKRREKIIIGDNIEIMILDVGRRRVRFGINAPKEIPVRSQTNTTEPSGKDEEGNPEPVRKFQTGTVSKEKAKKQHVAGRRLYDIARNASNPDEKESQHLQRCEECRKILGIFRGQGIGKGETDSAA